MSYIPVWTQHKSRVENFLKWKLISEKDCKALFDGLSTHIEGWKKKDADAAKRKYYMDKMFPLVKQIFDLQVTGDLLHPETGHLIYGDPQPHEIPHPKVLIQLVGFSIEPLLLSALAIRPTEKLVLLFSKETEHESKNALCQLIGEQGGGTIVVVDSIDSDAGNVCLVDSSNPASIFNAVRKAANGFPSQDVVLDLTGGKKSMVSAAFLAAIVDGYAVYYVDHEFYDRTTPFPGTEFLSRLRHPISVKDLEKKIRDRFPGNAQSVNAFIAEINAQFTKVGLPYRS